MREDPPPLPSCPRCAAPDERASIMVPCTNCGFPGELSTKLPATMAEQLHAQPKNKTTGETQFVAMMRACLKAGVSLAFMLETVEAEVNKSKTALSQTRAKVDLDFLAKYGNAHAKKKASAALAKKKTKRK